MNIFNKHLYNTIGKTTNTNTPCSNRAQNYWRIIFSIDCPLWNGCARSNVRVFGVSLMHFEVGPGGGDMGAGGWTRGPHQRTHPTHPVSTRLDVKRGGRFSRALQLRRRETRSADTKEHISDLRTRNKVRISVSLCTFEFRRVCNKKL